jgi:hypothetical protein
MAVVVSREAMESDHIKDEINLGKDARIPFFPVRVEDVPLIGSFKYHLGRAQWNDCFSGIGSQRFLNVAAEIAGFLGVVERSRDNRTQTVDPVATPLNGADVQCPTCGATSPTGARFCQDCGIRLEEQQVQIGDAGRYAISKVAIRRQSNDKSSGMKPAEQLCLDYWTQLLALANQKTTLHADVKPPSKPFMGCTVGRGLRLVYVSNAHASWVELYIHINAGEASQQKSKEKFHQLLRDRETIESRFGGPLDWQELSEKIACRICAHISGGTKSPRDQWPAIHAAMVDTMIRLHDALQLKSPDPA